MPLFFSRSGIAGIRASLAGRALWNIELEPRSLNKERFFFLNFIPTARHRYLVLAAVMQKPQTSHFPTDQLLLYNESPKTQR